MNNNEHQERDDKKLRKYELIRGNDAYLNVLNNSVAVSANFLSVFVNIKSGEIDFTNSPHFTNNVKVGFIIAKKKIKKAVHRNRIRRLLKEAYRLNKNLFKVIGMDLCLIFSLNKNGYEQFIREPRTDYLFIEKEMKLLSAKFQNYVLKK